MKELLRSGKALTIVLWLVAMHSFCVGVCLIVMPASLFSYFGFGIGEKFFATQGGVFHIVMSICYFIVAFNDITTSALLGKKELKNMKQLMYDFFSMSLQMAKDEIEDIYENLEQKLSGEKIKNLTSHKHEKEKQKMISQLSSFYQDFPSG